MRPHLLANTRSGPTSNRSNLALADTTLMILLEQENKIRPITAVASHECMTIISMQPFIRVILLLFYTKGRKIQYLPCVSPCGRSRIILAARIHWQASSCAHLCSANLTRITSVFPGVSLGTRDHTFQDALSSSSFNPTHASPSNPQSTVTRLWSAAYLPPRG
ncbi:hypothetical protein A0H81_08044 [Grifola frondosa]|uniref:Uncharacterized protein n=1 Tax=Grifola frondosa TaxID=5627 RepID=A0A1C7M583_GRIFR|nr:hypothetical protein A0H81_08044 [Grifola frondosa]